MRTLPPVLPAVHSPVRFLPAARPRAAIVPPARLRDGRPAPIWPGARRAFALPDRSVRALPARTPPARLAHAPAGLPPASPLPRVEPAPPLLPRRCAAVRLARSSWSAIIVLLSRSTVVICTSCKEAMSTGRARGGCLVARGLRESGGTRSYPEQHPDATNRSAGVWLLCRGSSGRGGERAARAD